MLAALLPALSMPVRRRSVLPNPPRLTSFFPFGCRTYAFIGTQLPNERAAPPDGDLPFSSSPPLRSAILRSFLFFQECIQADTALRACPPPSPTTFHFCLPTLLPFYLLVEDDLRDGGGGFFFFLKIPLEFSDGVEGAAP